MAVETSGMIKQAQGEQAGGEVGTERLGTYRIRREMIASVSA